MIRSRLVTEDLRGDNFRLVEDFTVDLPEVAWLQGKTIRVPAGFVFDRASVPSFLRGLITRVDSEWAAVVHDWACRKKNYLLANGSHIGVSRKCADQVFYVMLRADGVPFLKARIMYLGVRSADKTDDRSSGKNR